MSDESSVPTGQVASTPEAGPVDEGAPASAPGAGQVYSTPEAGPSAEGETLTPPTWQEHMQGPILGLDDTPAPAAAPSPPAATREEPRQAESGPAAAQRPISQRTAQDDAELKKWPPYTGKPVSEVGDVMRYAAPVVAQAEKLAIRAIDLTGRGLSGLARLLDERRVEREKERERDRGSSA